MRQDDVAAATRALLADPLKAPAGSDGALTHFDAEGQAHMVDVSDKAVTDRHRGGRGARRMAPETLALIVEGRAKKGDVAGRRAAGRDHGRRSGPPT